MSSATSRSVILPRLTRAEIGEAYRRIASHLRQTPVLVTNGRDFGLTAFALTIKLEQLQVAGCFKARGAFANLLLRDVPAAGVIAASGGNHGVAVAYAAGQLGHPAQIFVPSVASPAKIARIRSYGATLQVVGDLYADALAASETAVAASGAMAVHAFDQRETLLGQGTLALELSRQAPELDTVLVAVGGGGLIGGVSAWYAGDVRVIGVEPAAAPTLTRALAAGCPVDAPAGGIAADSLAPTRVGNLPLAVAQAHVSGVLLVDDRDIVAAQRALWNVARIVAEPGAAAPLAALLSGAYEPAASERVAVIVSGGNTDAVTFADARQR
jgi:threonine dehydratase